MPLWPLRAGPCGGPRAAPCLCAARTGGGSIAREMAAAAAAREGAGNGRGREAGRRKPLSVPLRSPCGVLGLIFTAFPFPGSARLKNAVSTSSWCPLRRQGHLCVGTVTKASKRDSSVVNRVTCNVLMKNLGPYIETHVQSTDWSVL